MIGRMNHISFFNLAKLNIYIFFMSTTCLLGELTVSEWGTRFKKWA